MINDKPNIVPPPGDGGLVMTNNDKKKYVFRMPDGIKFCREKKKFKGIENEQKSLGGTLFYIRCSRNPLLPLEKKPEGKGIGHMVI